MHTTHQLMARDSHLGMTWAHTHTSWLKVPLLLQGLPSGAASLWVLLFHGGIAAMLGLYFLFWIRLNLAQTIPMALGLGLFVAGEWVMCWGYEGRPTGTRH